jgi:hypothetical protein
MITIAKTDFIQKQQQSHSLAHNVHDMASGQKPDQREKRRDIFS